MAKKEKPEKIKPEKTKPAKQGKEKSKKNKIDLFLKRGKNKLANLIIINK